jgi:hypothetical protein
MVSNTRFSVRATGELHDRRPAAVVSRPAGGEIDANEWHRALLAVGLNDFVVTRRIIAPRAFAYASLRTYFSIRLLGNTRRLPRVPQLRRPDHSRRVP